MLRLTIPSPHKGPALEIETRVGGVRTWLDELPYVAADQAAGQIYEQLKTLNRVPLAPAHRQQLMDLYRQAHQRLQASLIRAQFNTSRPSLVSDTVGLRAKLAQEMAYGYKIVIHDAVNPSAEQSNPDWLIAAIYHAISYLSLQTIECYSEYIPSSNHLWQEIVALYLYAEEQRIPEKTVRLGDDEQTCVSDAFKLIALLRLSDPYRLGSGQIWDLYHYLQRHRSGIDLQAPRNPDENAGVFVLDFENHRTRSTGPREFEHHQLDCRRLINLSQQHLEQLNSGAKSTTIGLSASSSNTESIQLLRNLIVLWARSPERKSPRFDAHGKIEIYIGLEASFAGVNNETSTANPPTACHVMNRSRGGMALQGNAISEAPVRVGQLVIIRTAEVTSEWRAAVIRWLMRPDTEQLQWGLQYIGDRLNPVHVLPANGQTAREYPAIAGQLGDAESDPRILITPGGTYADGVTLAIRTPEQLQTAKCTRFLESGTGWERFCYERQDD